MLDSEFAQEESRQIEAYFKAVNKESSERMIGGCKALH